MLLASTTIMSESLLISKKFDKCKIICVFLALKCVFSSGIDVQRTTLLDLMNE